MLTLIIYLVTLGLSLTLAAIQFAERMLSTFLSHILSHYSETRLAKIQSLRSALSSAGTYAEYASVAEELDEATERAGWKSEPGSEEYDETYIGTQTESLRAALAESDYPALANLLRKSMFRNNGGIANPRLFSATHVGTKEGVDAYISAVSEGLEALADAPVGPESVLFPDLQAKVTLFWELRQSYGRSALLLSGGASNGMYHLGIIKALAEAGLLPRVLSGSSVGSLVAAMVCARTDEEVAALLQDPGSSINLNAFDSLAPGSLARKAKRLVSEGVLMDISKLADCLRDNIGDLTFAEAFARSGRILNITVSSTATRHRSRLLNYLSAPDVLVWSAALASCAIPYVYRPVEILARDVDGKVSLWEPSGEQWMDGSVYHDLPMARLGSTFNVNYFIVSQVNPHAIPFVSAPRIRTRGSFISRVFSSAFYLVMSEAGHRLRQLRHFRLLPRVLAQILPLIEQRYHGDITFVPASSSLNVAKLISNPTEDLIVEATRRGECAVWEKMDRVGVMTRVERDLERLLARTRTRERQRACERG